MISESYIGLTKTTPGENHAEWKSLLVSHFPLPADLWPCCTSVVPALAAAQHPPALPGAAAEHPNEKEGQIKDMSREEIGRAHV